MHMAIMRWIERHRPWVHVLAALVLLIDFALLAGSWLEPWMRNVFEGPDVSICLRAQQTQSKRDIEACCAEEAWPDWPACEGTAAKRRQDAMK